MLRLGEGWAPHPSPCHAETDDIFKLRNWAADVMSDQTYLALPWVDGEGVIGDEALPTFADVLMGGLQADELNRTRRSGLESYATKMRSRENGSLWGGQSACRAVAVGARRPVVWIAATATDLSEAVSLAPPLIFWESLDSTFDFDAFIGKEPLVLVFDQSTEHAWATEAVSQAASTRSEVEGQVPSR